MDIQDKIDTFLDDCDNPDWVKEAHEDHLLVIIEDWQGEHELTISMSDVANYYCTEASNMSSGCRRLAGWVGDWRPIDNLAKFCSNYFKSINSDAFRKVCIDHGLSPKF
jgi:hypothetical protein